MPCNCKNKNLFQKYHTSHDTYFCILVPLQAENKNMNAELSGHYSYRRIITTMTPMVLMMIVISIYSIVDGFFISNFAGSDAFAGMNLIWPPIALVGALGLMVGSGGSALVSKTLGEGDELRASRIFSMLVRLILYAGVIIAAVMFVFMPDIARLLGADEAMMPHAILYGRILISVLPAYMYQMAFQPFFMVAEKPQMGTAVSIACGITNIVLDAVLVGWLGFGLAGAAIASSVSLLIGGGFPLWYFSSRRNDTHIRMERCPMEWASIRQSCLNGLSEFVGNIALNIITICYNWQLMRIIGADGVSAYGIVMYIGFIFGAVFIGYNMGISQVISYNFGAGNNAELRSLLRKSLVIIGIVGVMMTTVAELGAPLVARIFVGYDETLSEVTCHATRIYMLSFLICGFNMFVSAWFTALNNGVVSAIAAFGRTLVFELASVFILPLLWGLDGVWVSVNVAETLALVLSLILMLAYRRRYGY